MYPFVIILKKKKRPFNSTVDEFGDVPSNVFDNTIDMRPLSQAQQQSVSQFESPQPESSQLQIFQQIGTQSSKELISDMKSNPPKEDDRLVIEGYDFSKAFFDFRLSLLDEESPITIGNHVEHILALSSILLMKPGRIHKDIANSLEGHVDTLIAYLKDLFEITESLPWDLISTIGKIVEDVKQQKITRTKGINKLLAMEDKLPSEQFRVIKATSNLLDKVPRIDISDEIKEQEPSTRFIEPLLSGLFDDPDNDVLLRLQLLFIVIQ